MPLKNRVYICPDCGYLSDRDLNAARNIDRWFEDIHVPKRSESAKSALSSVSVPSNFVRTVSSTEIACGADKPLRSHSKTAVKQEVNAKTTQV
jgi:putative transposase